MAQESGFFNAQLVRGGEYDRVYTAEQFAAYFASFIGNGVFGQSMQKLQVLSGEVPDMTVQVLSGEAWINGWWYRLKDTLIFNVPVADGVLSRKDIIVIRWGNTERDIWLEYVSGVPSAEPKKPQLRRNADYYDLQLAVINVTAGSINITQSKIEDTRLDNEVCGLVTGVVDQIDTTNLYNQFTAYFNEFKLGKEADFDKWTSEQKIDYLNYVAQQKKLYDDYIAKLEADYDSWTDDKKDEWTNWVNIQEADFMAWYDRMKDLLSDTQAGNLQNQIDHLEATTRDILRWNCNVGRNIWSRVLYISGFVEGVLSISLSQNSQTLEYEYHIGTGYSSAYIAQIGSSGFSTNSEIKVRIMRHSSSAVQYYVEVYNPYVYNNSSYTQAYLEFEQYSRQPGTNTVTPVTVLTGADDDYPHMRAMITSKYDGIVAKKVYAEGLNISDSSGSWCADVSDGNFNLKEEASNEVVFSVNKDTKVASFPSVIKEQQGHYVANTNGGAQASTYGYINFARIKIKKQYADGTIEFLIGGRGRTSTTKVSVRFSAATNNDPTLSSFAKSGDTSYHIYIVKSAASTWDLYAQKAEAYGTCKIFDQRVWNDAYFDITYPDTLATQIGENWVETRIGEQTARANIAALIGNNGTFNNPMKFYWTGSSGQPTWLWGSNGEKDSDSNLVMKVYDPENFDVRSCRVLETYAANGNLHGNMSWLLKCQHDIYGDGMFGFKWYEGTNSGNAGIRVDKATFAECPSGFTSRTSDVWGNQTGEHVTSWDVDSCSVQFRKNNPSAGRLSMLIDGYIYQKEGQKRVLDESDLDSGLVIGGTGLDVITSNYNGARVHSANSAARFSLLTNDGTQVYRTLSLGVSSLYEATSDGVLSLGAPLSRWNQIYAVNSAISTSDKNEKYDISYIGSESEFDTSVSDELLTDFIMGMNPVVFKRTNGESRRPHHGLIAQDIEELLSSLEIDHAGFIKSPVIRQAEVYEVDGQEVMRRDLEGVPSEEIPEEILEEYGEAVEKRIEEEVVEGKFKYGLRYEEFVGDIVRFCQLLKVENDELKKEMLAIKSDMELLKSKYNSTEKRKV